MMPTALKASPATVTQSLAVALTQCTLSAYPASAPGRVGDGQVNRTDG
jgi:hypothetical protein